jgi:hypothetical protein
MRLRFKSNVALGEISAFLFKMEHYPTREKSILEKIPIKAVDINEKEHAAQKSYTFLRSLKLINSLNREMLYF